MNTTSPISYNLTNNETLLGFGLLDGATRTPDEGCLKMPEEEVSRSSEAEVSFRYDYSSCRYSSNGNPEISDDEFFDLMPSDVDVDDKDDDDVDDHDDCAGNSFRAVIDIVKSKNKALHELRCRVEDAIIKNHIYGMKNIHVSQDSKDVEIWGVPLLPSVGHEATNIVLMKFLKAKNYRVSKAFRLLQATMAWRRDLRIDESFHERSDDGLENTWDIQGRDYEGRPVCYYRPGVFENRDLRKKYLETKEKCSKYMRWRLQCVERGVREIVFRDGGSNSIVQIIDLNNAHSKAMKELHHSINMNLLSLVHEMYPGIVHKNLFINVPLWYMAVHTLKMNLNAKRTKKNYVFVRSLKVTETLLKLLPPEIIAMEYGGLKRENDNEFSSDDKALEAIVRANCTTHIKIPIDECDVTVTWDLVVVGFNVTYKEEFVPDDDCSYKVLIQKEKKMQATIRNSFHIKEPGIIKISIANGTFKKKKVLYRYKSTPSIPLYMYMK